MEECQSLRLASHGLVAMEIYVNLALGAEEDAANYSLHVIASAPA